MKKDYKDLIKTLKKLSNMKVESHFNYAGGNRFAHRIIITGFSELKEESCSKDKA